MNYFLILNESPQTCSRQMRKGACLLGAPCSGDEDLILSRNLVQNQVFYKLDDVILILRNTDVYTRGVSAQSAQPKARAARRTKSISLQARRPPQLLDLVSSFTTNQLSPSQFSGCCQFSEESETHGISTAREPNRLSDAQHVARTSLL